MGMLQENKSRKKISNDPNNTKWTRDTTTFGQRILRSQGWQPGQFLGAQNAPHAELHSAASASYIRVVLKDDMKGLGFNKAKEDEVTGLDVFSDLLSRLNGKSEAAVEQDQQARLAVKTNRYVEMRWGPMRFVRGGLLVGDKLQEEEGGGDAEGSDSSPSDAADGQSVQAAKTVEAKKEKKEKRGKKRKAAVEDENSGDSEEEAAAMGKKDKKRRRRDEGEDTKAEKKQRRKEKGEKKKKKKKDKKDKKQSESGDDDDESVDDAEKKAAKKLAKKEKKERRKEKRERKEEKRRRKAATAAADGDSDSSNSDSDEEGDSATTADKTRTCTPATRSGTSTPMGSRNFVRSRFIAQKRQAVMDAKALNQIFMIKA